MSGRSRHVGHVCSCRGLCSTHVSGGRLYPRIVRGANHGEEHHQPAPHPGGAALLLPGLCLDVARLRAEATSVRCAEHAMPAVLCAESGTSTLF